MGEKILEIKNFSKEYSKGKKVVEDINLIVQQGDIYGFIGHNGAGKTTTIRALVGVMDFQQGEIIIDGQSIKKNPVLCKSKMAYIPDNPDLYDYITGIQYLNYMGNIYRVPLDILRKRIIKYASVFEITKSLGDLISSYSHGMKQKLALIGALIHEPKLLVLDEPFVGLDPEASFRLKEIMKELCNNGGAIFFSTHVLDVAEKLCNKIAIIKNGKLILAGETNKIIGEKSLESIFMEVVGHDK